MYKFFITIFLYSLSVSIFAQSSQTFRQEINSLLLKTHEDISIAIVVSDPKTSKILFQKNIDKNYIPASTLKLFTAFSALHFLGMDYRFKTLLLTNSQKLSDSHALDNVYLKFNGDPSLVVADLDRLLQELQRHGINKILNQFVIDDSTQDDKFWSLGTLLEDTKFCFAAPIGAIIINENCIHANAIMDKNHHIKISADEASFVKIVNEMKFSPSKLDPELKVNNDNSYFLTGYMNETIPLKIAIQNNRLFCKNIITYLLKKHQITVNHGIHFAPAPKKTKLISMHESPPVHELTANMLKESNNIIANSLFRTFGDHNADHPATWKDGAIAMQSLLIKKLKITPNQIAIFDGSGGSIYNMIKPRHLIKLLNYIFIHNYSNFIGLLPKGGVDGTLKNRMKSFPINVYAKTGTERGVSSLAGFIETKKKQTLSFAIMINNGLLENNRYKTMEDEICYLIYKHF